MQTTTFVSALLTLLLLDCYKYPNQEGWCVNYHFIIYFNFIKTPTTYNILFTTHSPDKPQMYSISNISACRCLIVSLFSVGIAYTIIIIVIFIACPERSTSMNRKKSWLYCIHLIFIYKNYRITVTRVQQTLIALNKRITVHLVKNLHRV